MELGDLEVLIVVAREGSFTRAGERLGRTQPAISQTIRRLEGACGARLFTLRGNRPELTPAGQLLVEHGKRVLAAHDEAQQAIADLQGVRRGALVIGVDESLAVRLLPVAASFQLRHAEIAIHVHTFKTTDVVGTGAGAPDFGFVSFRPKRHDLEWVRYATPSLVAVVLPSHPLAVRASITIHDLARERLIVHPDGSSEREGLRESFAQLDVPFRAALECPTTESIKRGVEHGLGLAVLPDDAIRLEVGEGRLVGVRVNGVSDAVQVGLVYSKRHGLSAAASAFVALGLDATDAKPSRRTSLRRVTAVQAS